MDTNESLTEVEAMSFPHAQVVAMLLAGLVSASALTAPTADAQASTARPGQQVALVTGSTSGLGHELALRLGSPRSQDGTAHDGSTGRWRP